MTQNVLATIDPNAMSGTALAAWLESFKANIYSGNRGAARPSYVVTGMIWPKSISSTSEELYCYDGSGDILLGSFNPTDHTLVALLLKSLDPGATYGPDLLLDRASHSPAASDILGAVRWGMRNASAAQVIAALDTAEILDTTAGSEDARRIFQSIVAGSLATRMMMGAGLYMTGATGGDPGAGKINATGLQVNGVDLSATAAKSVPVRQTVLSGPVDSNGLPSFGGSTGSTTVTASGAIVATAANGAGASGAVDRVGAITNPSWTGLSTNGTMYLYLDIAADGTCTPGAGTLTPTYRPGGADVVTANQFTFNVQEMVGKVGNGSSAAQTYRVYVGEVTVAGGVVTAITWYAIQGRYVSAFAATLPGTSAAITVTHNLGAKFVIGRIIIQVECTTTDGTYAVGDIVYDPDTDMSTNYATSKPPKSITGPNTLIWTTGNFGAFYSNSKTAGGVRVVLTAASWKYRTIINRGW